LQILHIKLSNKLSKNLALQILRSNIDILRKKITYVKRDNKDFLFVQDLFLSGMGPFATPKNILHVYLYSPNDTTGLCRLGAFERQMKFTKEHGDANVRYGWLGCRKNDIVRILTDGLDTTGKLMGKSDLNAGIYLSPENRAFVRYISKSVMMTIMFCNVIQYIYITFCFSSVLVFVMMMKKECSICCCVM
jgi:hypothetical protein